MIDLFLASENMAFSVALILLIGIALLEGVMTFIGLGFSQFLENLLPDLGGPDADMDMDADVDVEAPSVFTRLFGWIKIKGVPMVVVLVVFLTFFSLSGFILQSFALSLLGLYLPGYIAFIPALAIALFLVRQVSLVLARVAIKDETSAVSTETFIGKIAVITLGTAKPGCPAEARLTDRYGQAHYVRVEPENDTDEFPLGTQLLLVRKQGHIFKVIQNPNLNLTD